MVKIDLEYDIMFVMGAERRHISEHILLPRSPGESTTRGRETVLPIAPIQLVSVRKKPLFVDQMPAIAQSDFPWIWDLLQGEEAEVIIGDRSPTDIIEGSYIARISARGAFPHGRSLEYHDHTHLTAKNIVIAARDGSLHRKSSFSLKGGDYDYPMIIWSDYNPAHALLNGIVTKEDARKAIAVSNILLEHGIEAEVVVGASQLEEIPLVTERTDEKISYEMVPPEVFREHLLETAKEFNTKPNRPGTLRIQRVRDFLNKTDFVLLHRVMNVPFRLSDVTKPFDANGSLSEQDKQEEFISMINYILSYVNSNRSPAEKISYIGGASSSRLHPEWVESISAYWDYMTEKLGTQVGKMHKLGISHGWLHRGNIVADGSVCDLDSIGGISWQGSGTPALKKKPIDPYVAARDLSHAAQAIMTSTASLVDRNLLNKTNDEVIRAFIIQYVKSRWGDNPDKQAIKELLPEFVYLYVYGHIASTTREVIESTLEDLIKKPKRPKKPQP